MEILQVKAVTMKEGAQTLIDGLSFTIKNGEQWAIIGPSGSGKTSLLRALAGNHAYSGSIVHDDSSGTVQKIVLVDQQHRFKNLSNTNAFYYQQRFNSSDAEDAPTVEEELQHYIPPGKNIPISQVAEVKELLALLKLQDLLPEKLIQLSNGENKRLQIAKALLLHPSILLLDNPFTGLDVEARKILNDLLDEICKKGIHIVMVTSGGQVPHFITHVLNLRGNGVYNIQTREVFLTESKRTNNDGLFKPDEKLLNQLMTADISHDFQFAVNMRNVNIEYHNRAILSQVNWDVKKGERWALSGPNGAGKSTLLSLINADNPQAYANEIYLFDRKRGTGETIWEIKKKIGFVSPELHLYFDTGIPVFDVVASGLFDTIGLFRLLNNTQSELVLRWMRLLHTDHLAKKLLFQLSNSEQRLVLLARALVKNPPLLILDEPCQGLDDTQVTVFKEMVNKICLLGNKTLIYVSHYPAEIPDCVDKFIRLEQGRIVDVNRQS